MIKVSAPEGSFLNCKYPAAVAARGVTGYRIDDSVFGALSKVLPRRIPAASEGGNTSLRMAGLDANGRQFIVGEVVCGSRGARPNKDGIEGINNPTQNLSNTPVEALEAGYPLRVLQYGFVPDTGGAGLYRGGLSLVREWEYLTDAMLQVRSDRAKFVPWGTQQGNPGTPSENLLNAGATDEQRMPAKFVKNVRRGDRFRHVTPGAGGYGDPLKRDPNQVKEDILDGKLSIEYARRVYGTVVDPATQKLDAEATYALRQELSRKVASEQQLPSSTTP